MVNVSRKAIFGSFYFGPINQALGFQFGKPNLSPRPDLPFLTTVAVAFLRLVLGRLATSGLTTGPIFFPSSSSSKPKWFHDKQRPVAIEMSPQTRDGSEMDLVFDSQFSDQIGQRSLRGFEALWMLIMSVQALNHESS